MENRKAYEKIPFDPSEITEKAVVSSLWGDMITFKTPITAKENYFRNIYKQAVWQPMDGDLFIFSPNNIPDNVAAGLTSDATALPVESYGGKDMFGVEWEYVPEAGGAIEKPGRPHLLEDATEWKEKLTFPNVDSWDWEDAAKRNIPMLEENKGSLIQIRILTGYFERLISFMGFENAAMAMIDSDQIDAVKELFEALTDLYIEIIDHYRTYYPGLIDEVCIHDDWGSQRTPLFSEAVVRDVIFPALSRLVAHIDECGYLAMLHSCGKIEPFVPYMIAAGFQSWEAQENNDLHMVYEKYGDKLNVTITVPPLPEDASDEMREQAMADAVQKFCHTGKGCVFCGWGLTVQDQENIYRMSREAFLR